MMAEVACFCGCCFGFDGGAAACPSCGEVASVLGGPVFGQDGQPPDARPERAEAGAVSGRDRPAAPLRVSAVTR